MVKFGAKSLLFTGLFTSLCMGAAATSIGVSDKASFFSKEAVKLSNDTIQEIKKNFNREVRIETVQTIPLSPNRTPEMDQGTQPDPVFAAWAKSRLESTGERNIYLVISKNPSYIMAAVGNQARQSNEFTENDRNVLIKILADHFQAKRYDRALLDAVNFVQDAMRANRMGTPISGPAAKPAVSSANPDVTFLWRWIGFGCAALLAVLLIVGLVKGYKTPAGLPKAEEPVA